MRDALDEQIDAYDEMHADLLREYGAAWVLIADRKLVSTFSDFSSAAKYALTNLPSQQVLIRHTKAPAFETAPYVHLAV